MTNMQTVGHGGTNVYTGMESRFDDMKSELKELGKMRDQIKNNPNLSKSEKESMLKDLDRAETAIKQGLDYATASAKYDTTSGNTRNDGDLAAVEAAMARAETAMNHVEQELMIANRLPPADVSGPSNASCGGSTQSTSGASGSGGASGTNKTDDANKTSGNSGEQTAMADLDVENMISLLSTDPQAAMEQLSKLPPEERGEVLQVINTQLQQMNQLFSMMSNMMKSLHDTAKAAINNMRV